MSSKKKGKKNRQTKIKTNNKKQELQKLTVEVLMLQNEIKQTKLKNLKNTCIKNLKIFGSACNFIAPFIIVGGLSVGAIWLIGEGYPMVKDDVTQYKLHCLEYQYDNSIKLEEKYYENSLFSEALPISNLKIYSPWKINDEGIYTRNIRTYDLDMIETFEFYNAVLDKNIDYVSEKLTDYEEEIENTNQKQEIDGQYFIEATLNALDKTDSLIVKESNFNNILVTIIELVSTLGLGFFIDYKRDFDVRNSVRRIKRNYKILPIDPLKQELSEKQQKILSLTKGGNSNAK